MFTHQTVPTCKYTVQSTVISAFCLLYFYVHSHTSFCLGKFEREKNNHLSNRQYHGGYFRQFEHFFFGTQYISKHVCICLGFCSFKLFYIRKSDRKSVEFIRLFFFLLAIATKHLVKRGKIGTLIERAKEKTPH